MHILRSGGRYLQGWEQQAWAALFVVLLVPLAAVLIAGRSVFVFPIAVVALLAVPKIVRTLKRVRKGRLGEALVTDLLGHLSDDYWLINDVTMQSLKGNIDHILIGPCGVVVIETKRLSGRIRCDGDRWWINDRPRRSMSMQATRGALALKDFLVRRHPELRSGPLSFVEAVVVFTDPRCELDIARPRGTIVVWYSELRGVVVELARKHQVGPAAAQKLAKTLAGASRATLRSSV